jgi:zinc-binding in reverse transcriptase
VSGLFSVHLFYEWLDFGGIISNEFNIVWQSKIPFKVKIFMWLVRRKRILTKDQLFRKGWTGDSCCVFCGEHDDIHHIFVNCSTVQVICN